ncbi:MAG: ribose-5-phosphate isomerase RpiA [Candidatus Thermoplasmatota archaeon]|jgi:ribose 5-phosphate isomerase A|nr:ribose-5-phosphate isomerase RpiA [Candidatus Thermoplasmatota archaeon]MCL5800084.1 ribose-5-phosphate isomerase RpiA [Candidatus Thermoplasmatota archaeon]
MQDLEAEKKLVAVEALKLIKDGMSVGLGTGSTVKYFLEGLAALVQDGLEITGIPTSRQTEQVARKLGIPLDLDINHVDVDVDGTDAFDLHGTLIKGGGGALFREKVVAYNSSYVVIIADSTKLRQDFHGETLIPVEILPFGKNMTVRNLERLGCNVALRHEGKFITDGGNIIADCTFAGVDDPGILEKKMKAIPGVIEAGIFNGIANLLIFAKDKSIARMTF